MMFSTRRPNVLNASVNAAATRCPSGRRTGWSRFATLSLACVSVGLASVSAASGQTSGTWVTSGNGNWNDGVNWSSGNVPTAGGVATFSDSTTLTTVTLSGTTATVSAINYSSPITYYITNAAGGTLNLVSPVGGGNAVINVAKSITFNPSFTSTGLRIDAPIVSTTGFTKTGPGWLTFGAPFSVFNSFAGTIELNQGTLEIFGGNSSLGASSNALSFNGGTLRVAAGQNVSGSRAVSIGAGGGTIEVVNTIVSDNFADIGTVSNGAGVGTFTKTGAGDVRVRGSSTFSGTVSVRTGKFFLAGGTAQMQAVSNFDVAGTLHLNNRDGTGFGSGAFASNNTDRVSDTANITLRGGEFVFSGGSFVAASETVGTVTLAPGLGFVTVNSNPAQPATLTINTLARNAGGALVVRSDTLNTSGAAGTSTVILTNAAPTVGSGALGTTSVGITPWLFASAVNGTTTGSASSFAVREPGGQLRPLGASETTSNLALAGENNILLSGGGNLAASKTINSLTLSGALTRSSNQVLTVRSGAILGTGINTIDVPLVVPDGREALLAFAGSTTTSQPISGTGGLTKAMAGLWRITGEGNSSTYTGTTTISGGRVVVNSNLTNTGAPSPLGTSSSPIVIAAGANISNIETGIGFAGSVTVSRNLVVTGNGNGVARLTNVDDASGGIVTVNGGVQLDRDLQLDFGFGISPNTLDFFTNQPLGYAEPTNFNGVVSGTGRLTDRSDAYSVIALNASNTYSGGTFLTTGYFIAGHDNAFGTGAITTGAFYDFIDDAVNGPSIGGSNGPRTIPNPLIIGQTLDTRGSSDLTFTGDVDLSGAALLSIQNANTTLAGPIHDGALIKLGNGNLYITGNANTYIGGTEVEEGTLFVGNGGTSGAILGDVFLLDGATLAFNRSDSYLFAGNFDRAATFGLGGFISQVGSGTTTLTGSIIATDLFATAGRLQLGNSTPAPAPSGLTFGNVLTDSSVSFNYSTDLVLTANIYGNGGVVIAGPSTVTFTADYSYAGTTEIRPGATLKLVDGGNPIGGSDVTIDGNLILERSGDPTFNNNFAGAGRLIQAQSTTVTLVGTSLHASTSVTAPNGRLVATNTLGDGTGDLVVSAAGASVALEANPSASSYVTAGNFTAITVASGATVTVPAAARPANLAKVVVTGSLDLAQSGNTFGGFLDLGNADLISRSGNVATLRAAVAAFLATGNTGLGATAIDANTTLAVFPNLAGPGIPYYSSYDGIALTSADVIVKFTYKGDTNIDGVLDGIDFANLIEGYSTGATGWQNGDFNYDGVVNITDINLFTSTLAAVGSNSLGNGQGAPNSSGGAIPEPSALGLLLPAVALVTRRRR